MSKELYYVNKVTFEELLSKSGKSPQDLSNLAVCSTTTINNIRRNTPVVLTTVKRLASFFGCDFRRLIIDSSCFNEDVIIDAKVVDAPKKGSLSLIETNNTAEKNSKNYMKHIANMFGVGYGENFTVASVDGKKYSCMMTNKGIMVGDDGLWMIDNHMILKIITGEMEVTK